VPEPLTMPATPAVPVERRRRKRIDARRGTRVLIIDDSATVLAALRKHLTSVGHVAIEAPDAETGLALLRTQKPDLIFLDIILPRMDGFAALRHIRRDPLGKTIPVIMMSGNELAAEQFYANRIGADDFMKKPFMRRDVFLRIEALLDDALIPRHISHRPPAPSGNPAYTPEDGLKRA
jgi:DNA-binding response OmpR family regulator